MLPLIPLLIGGGAIFAFEASKSKSKVNATVGYTPSTNVNHAIIQDKINQFMADPNCLHNLDYIKVGGASGTKANSSTAKAFIFSWSVGQTGADPTGALPDNFTYPNLSAHVNDNASDGLGRDKSSLFGGAFSTIVKLAPVVLALL